MQCCLKNFSAEQISDSGHVNDNVWVYRNVFGQVLIVMMERRREYRRILVVDAHVLVIGPLQVRPMH